MEVLVEELKYRSKLISKLDDDYNSIISQLRDSLNGDKSRQAFGCCILNLLISRCEQDVFEEHALLWIRSSLKIVNSLPSENISRLGYINLKELLTCSVKYDKLAREIGTKGIDPLLSHITGLSTPVAETLKLLYCCMDNYPSPCGRFRNGIEKFLLKSVLSKDNQICYNAGKCFPLLALCGSAGERKKKYAENWLPLLKSVMKTTRHYLQKFTNVISSSEVEISTDGTIKILELPQDNPMNSTEEEIINLTALLETCLFLLDCLFSKSTSFEVQVPVLLFIHLLCDVSNIQNIQCRVTNISDNFINMCKARIMKYFLSLITTFISQLSTLVTSYYTIIAKILISVLSSGFFHDRSAAYSCIMAMIIRFKDFPDNIRLFDEILNYIVQDISVISFSSEKMQIRSSQKPKKKLTHSQKFSRAIDDHNNSVLINDDNFKVKNCLEGLKLLKQIVVTSGSLISEQNLRILLSVIVKTISQLYGRDSKRLCPYDDKENVLQLFKVTHCIMNLYHHSYQVPVAILASLLVFGTKDNNEDVKLFCENCVLHADKLIHGSQPCFRENAASEVGLDQNQVPQVDTHIPVLPSSIRNNELPSIELPPKLNHVSQGNSDHFAEVQPQNHQANGSAGTQTQETNQSHDISTLKRKSRSADHVLQKDPVTGVLKRPGSEPISPKGSSPKPLTSIKNPVNSIINNNVRQGVVVVDSDDGSDASIAEVTSERPPKRSRKNNRSASHQVDEEPLSIKIKERPGEKVESDNNNFEEVEITLQKVNGVEEDELKAILDTFCEIEAE